MRPISNMFALALLATGGCSVQRTAVVPASGAAPIEVTGGEFYAEGFDANGQLRRTVTDRIDNDPELSCYGWQIAFRPQPGVRTLTERMTLPGPAAQWGGVDGVDNAPTRVASGRDGADTALVVALPEGTATHGWCVAAGDPVGRYTIEVLDGTRLLKRFDFTVGQVGRVAN